MKCPRCGKHRIRTKQTNPAGITWAATRVKYCIGCGWEKILEERPSEVFPLFTDGCMLVEDPGPDGKYPEPPPPEAYEVAREGTSCFRCPEKETCKYAWDPYNTNGDCLADK